MIGGRSRRAAIAIMALTATVVLAVAAPRPPGDPVLLSRGRGGGRPNSSSWGGAVTPGGRFAAFTSTARNIHRADRDWKSDVFVRDFKRRRTYLVSVDSRGRHPAGRSGARPAVGLSDDGRIVVFSTDAALVPDDTNSLNDVFVHDRSTRETWRLSVRADGSQSESESFVANSRCISGDGRFVTFMGGADLVAPSKLGIVVMLADLQENTIRPVSVGPQGQLPRADTGGATISTDGRYVGFDSNDQTLAENAVPIVTDGDVYVYDVEAQKLRRVSAAPTDGPGIWFSGGIIMLDDGVIAFTSFEVEPVTRQPKNEKRCKLLLDLRTGERRCILDGVFVAGALGAGGRILFNTPDDATSQVFLYDIASGQLRTVSTTQDMALPTGWSSIGSTWNSKGGLSSDGNWCTFSSSDWRLSRRHPPHDWPAAYVADLR